MSDEGSGDPEVTTQRQPLPPTPESSDTDRGDAGCDDAQRQLLARLAARDSSAMVELFQALSAPLYGAALRSLGDERDAEEALQDALVRIWQKAPGFDPAKSKPLTWCLMIVRGLCIDRLRKRSAAKRWAKTVSLDSVPEPASADEGTVRTLIFHERLQQVQDALGRLPARERRYIEMAVFGHVTHAQIAGQAGEPLGTVKTRIRRGMVKLRALLEQNCDD